jgi:hypothetical protein
LKKLSLDNVIDKEIIAANTIITVNGNSGVGSGLLTVAVNSESAKLLSFRFSKAIVMVPV